MMGPFKCTPKESDHKLISDAYKEIENCFDFVCDLCRNKPRICRKCGETEGNISCDWRRSDHLRCEKCQKIQFPIFENADYPFIEEWSYIDYEAIRNNIPCHITSLQYIDTLRLARLYGESPYNSLKDLKGAKKAKK